jgi:predicted Fe-Mo cluster-binding NifX family protein
MRGGKTMKIAISSMGKDLDAQIDPRFGRCQYFVLVDPETLAFETVENESLMTSGGAGIQAAQLVVRKGTNTLITGNLGPNAASALSAAGVRVYLVSGGTVREGLSRYHSGTLQEGSGPTVPSHSGLGRGQGMGRRGI